MNAGIGRPGSALAARSACLIASSVRFPATSISASAWYACDGALFTASSA
jgi:hypothetical protein